MGEEAGLGKESCRSLSTLSERKHPRLPGQISESIGFPLTGYFQTARIGADACNPQKASICWVPRGSGYDRRPSAHTKLIFHSGKEKIKIYICNSRCHLKGILSEFVSRSWQGNTVSYIHLTIPPLGKVILLQREPGFRKDTKSKKGQMEQLPSQPDQLNYPG